VRDEYSGHQTLNRGDTGVIPVFTVQKGFYSTLQRPSGEVFFKKKRIITQQRLLLDIST